MEMLGVPRLTQVEDATIAWSELGRGPPLVLLHGLADSHRTWRSVAPRLATHFRVLMPDLPGHGLSSRPDAPYTLDWYARVLGGWLDAANVAQAHVVGHSFGGGVAQWMLLDRRARVDKLVLVAPGGLGPEVSIGLRLASMPVLGRILAQPLMGVGTRVTLRMAGMTSREEIARAAWMNAAPGSGMAFHRTVTGCIDLFGQNKQTWDRIDEIALPPLALVWGERDPIIPIVQGVRAGERIEGAELSRYPDVGHFPHIEAADRFVGDVERFLEGPRTPSRVRVFAPRSHARKRGFFSRLGHALKRLARATVLGRD